MGVCGVKKFSLGKLILLLVLIIVILAVIFSAICVVFALQDNNRDKYTLDETDDSFLDIVLKSAVTGSEFKVTEAQINTYLDNKFCSGNESSNVLKNIRLYFHKNDDTELYARIRYKDHYFSVYAKTKIELDPKTGIAAVNIYNAKLGELPVPNFILNKVISHFSENQKYVSFDNNTLYIQTLYKYEFDTFTIALNLEKFDIEDGEVSCKTNSLTWEALKALKDYLLSDKGQEMCKRIFGYNLRDLKKDLLSAVFG